MPQSKGHSRSILFVIAMHLLPGVPVVLVYLGLGPMLTDKGYPALLALSFAALLGIVPLQFGHLLYVGYRRNGKFSLLGVIPESKQLGTVRFILYLMGALIILLLVSGMTYSIDSKTKEFFKWLPVWFFYDNDLAGFSQRALLTTAIVRLLVDGVVLPITEEIYFRGYLLQYMTGKVLHRTLYAAALFSVYHFWQPWNYMSLFLISIVLVTSVTKFKSLYLSIAIHMLANIVGTLLFFAQYIKV